MTGTNPLLPCLLRDCLGRLVIVGFCVGLTIVPAACRRADHDLSPASTSQQPGPDEPVLADLDNVPQTPMDTARLLRQYRASSRLVQLEPYLLPSHREPILDIILAIDQLTVAAEELRSAVGDTIGQATADLYDFTASANALELFSEDVEFIDEQIQGDRASVIIQVAGRVPLITVRFQRIDDRWILQTDRPVQGLSEAVVELASTMRRCADGQRRNGWTMERLRKELDRRTQAPRKELRRLQTQTGGAGVNIDPS